MRGTLRLVKANILKRNLKICQPIMKLRLGLAKIGRADGHTIREPKWLQLCRAQRKRSGQNDFAEFTVLP